MNNTCNYYNLLQNCELDLWEMIRQEKSFNAEPVFYGKVKSAYEPIATHQAGLYPSFYSG